MVKQKKHFLAITTVSFNRNWRLITFIVNNFCKVNYYFLVVTSSSSFPAVHSRGLEGITAGKMLAFNM